MTNKNDWAARITLLKQMQAITKKMEAKDLDFLLHLSEKVNNEIYKLIALKNN